MPIVLTCSVCMGTQDVEHFDLVLRVIGRQGGRGGRPNRAWAGGLELCRQCWSDLALPHAVVGWDGLQEKKAAMLAKMKDAKQTNA